MYRLYLVMKERSPDQITSKEISIASGKTVLDPAEMSDLLGTYEAKSSTIQAAFQKQVDAAAVRGTFRTF
jgi:hypothetical protein